MSITKQLLTVVIAAMGIATTFSQNKLQYFRGPGMDGLNVFETTKNDSTEYGGFKVRLGGDFALQFQAIDHENAAGSTIELENNFNLPTANMNFDVQLADGVRMHLRTYLSSRHHTEAYVKGGYLQIDKLDFIKEGFLSELMSIATIKIGMDQNNYGDAHFRRSDNAAAIYNPFVGNYIMDAFTTEPFVEVNLQKNGFLAVLGASNGKLNQSTVAPTGDIKNEPSFYGKLGYDKQLNEDLRVRLTGSLWLNNGTSRGNYLHSGDRAGGRYYNVMGYVDANGDTQSGGDWSGQIRPSFTKLQSFQINPFVKYRGLEFFGIYEVADGQYEGEGAYTQIAGEALYRFGTKNNFYVATRYNTVSGNMLDGGADQNVERFNVGGGWFMTNNILTKLEYVNQKYSGDGYVGNPQFEGGQFSGVVFEAVISF